MYGDFCKRRWCNFTHQRDQRLKKVPCRNGKDCTRDFCKYGHSEFEARGKTKGAASSGSNKKVQATKHHDVLKAEERNTGAGTKKNRSGQGARNKHKVWNYEWMRSLDSIIEDPITQAERLFAQEWWTAMKHRDQEELSELDLAYQVQHDDEVDYWKVKLGDELFEAKLEKFETNDGRQRTWKPPQPRRDLYYKPGRLSSPHTDKFRQSNSDREFTHEAKVQPAAFQHNQCRVFNNGNDIAYGWHIGPSHVLVQGHYGTKISHATYAGPSGTIRVALKQNPTELKSSVPQKDRFFVYETEEPRARTNKFVYNPAPSTTVGVIYSNGSVEALPVVIKDNDEQTLQYRATTTQGDCMSPIIDNEDSSIIGFHSGKYKGSTNEGFALALTAELVKQITGFRM